MFAPIYYKLALRQGDWGPNPEQTGGFLLMVSAMELYVFVLVTDH